MVAEGKMIRWLQSLGPFSRASFVWQIYLCAGCQAERIPAAEYHRETIIGQHWKDIKVCEGLIAHIFKKEWLKQVTHAFTCFF